LDGTLAEYHGWNEDLTDIGPPIPAMLERVKIWLDAGHRVKIFTARVDSKDPEELNQIVCAIQFWCKKHIGVILHITNVKDYGMIQLWDDRCVQVHPNTGIPVGDFHHFHELPKPKA
jgi:hypothetical protein